MTWARKLMLYLWGALIGTTLMFFSWFYFKPNIPIPSWLPASILMDRINKFPLNKPDKIKCLLNCYNISDTELMEIIEQKGVDYKNSEKNKKPWPVYYFNGKTKGNHKMQLKIEVADTLAATLVDIKIDSVASCNCGQ
ncbi:MAG: hypothetical protein A3K10_12970 [Bacteroidetes bacterium RIFCSPLOWO2_12_FULL_31_6]|nr:MAG: hypothetical protein A3K10_12970 [Bacteroidetes bacterium RIFCSPLOWO2_12_FULL_31_6]